MQLGAHIAPVAAAPLIDVDLGFGFQDGGDAFHRHGLVVHGAVQQEHQLLVHIGHGGIDDLVNVGQLLAGGVHLPVVGVANKLVILALNAVLAFLGGQHIGVQGGDARVVPEVVEHFLAHLAHIGELGAADGLAGGQGFLVLAVDDGLHHLFKDVLGGEVPLQVHGQRLDEVVLGGAESHGEGGVVHLFHHGGVAFGVLVAVAHALAVHLVEAHGVVEPHTILRGEGRAVGPLHALAQVDGVHGGVVIDGVALGHVGLHRAGHVEAEEALLDGLARVPVATAGRAPQLAAIGADGQVARVLHHHVGGHGQTVGHIAVNARLSEEGCLGEGRAFSQGSGGAHAQHDSQRQGKPLLDVTHMIPPVPDSVFDSRKRS